VDLTLLIAALDGGERAAHCLDLGHVGAGRFLDAVRPRLDDVCAAQRVGHVGNARFVRDHLLGAQRQPRRGLSRERERLVHGVGVQRLGAPATAAIA